MKCNIFISLIFIENFFLIVSDPNKKSWGGGFCKGTSRDENLQINWCDHNTCICFCG